jgi:DnaK suppressor protein
MVYTFGSAQPAQCPLLGITESLFTRRHEMPTKKKQPVAAKAKPAAAKTGTSKKPAPAKPAPAKSASSKPAAKAVATKATSSKAAPAKSGAAKAVAKAPAARAAAPKPQASKSATSKSKSGAATPATKKPDTVKPAAVKSAAAKKDVEPAARKSGSTPVAAPKASPKPAAKQEPAAPAKTEVVATVKKETASAKKEVPVKSKETVAAAARAPGATGARTSFKNFEPYIPQKGEEYMNAKQKDHFRSILNAWKSELMEEVDRTVSHMKDEAANFPDPADRATQEEEFSLELRARDRERKLIKKIESTLELIDADDYGYCEACGVEIGIKRLEARPTATLCIDCKTLDEIKEKQEHG